MNSNPETRGRMTLCLVLALTLGALTPLTGLGRQTANQQSGAQKSEPVESGSAVESGVVQQTTDQTQNPITQPLALSPEVSRKRVGVDESQRQFLTLQDAITLALQRNLDIEIFRQQVQMSQNALLASYGVYDIVSTADVGIRSETTPVDSVIAGGGQESAFNQRRFAYNFATRQEVEKTGGDWLMIFNNNRRVTNNQFSTLNPSFSTLLSITYTQPLLRDLSLDANRRTIQLNKRNLDISDSAFRQRVIEIISQVQRAYWDLVFSIRNEGIAREAVQLAKTQLENNRKMVEAGTLAPIELRSNEAALESRKEGVILALQGITTAENALKGLLINDPKDKLWSAAIEPTDEPQFGQSTHDLDEATRLALSNRPELEQTKLQIEQNDIDIKFFKNRLKPQLDLFATYSNSGLAGTARVPDRPPVPGEDPTTPPRLLGGFGQALSNLFSQDFRTYEVGVRISLPWRNRDAKGNLGRSLAESRQLDARQRQLVQNIQIEVRNALQSVEAARQRFEAQRANRIASDAQFKGELERFRAGLSTNFLVLTRQNELSVAKGNELRALTDYNKALADLQRVTGLTLVSNNIEIPQTQNQGSDKK